MRHARYRGRHRNPSHATRLTAAGAVGVGTLAVSVMAPATANAASGAQWDRVANCESGGNWHIDSGNGYYGGLQFSSSTWSSYDVDHYASRADLASRNEQINVADRVLDSQGWGAWPVCSQDRGAAGPSDARTSHTHHTHKATSHHHGITHSRGRYTVRSGDTLAGIAHKHHIKGGWRAVYRSNRHVIGANPSMIRAGMKLSLHA
jgi:hypothetical protein